MKKIGMFFVGMLLVISLVVPVWSQEVSLNPFYAQRNLDGKVRMHINMTGATNLLSTGFKVIFPVDKLQVESAIKNTDVWKFEPLEPDSKAYLPEVEVDNINGVVKMIGGRLTGVSGDVLLGWIVFQCSDTNTGEASVTVELANPPPYDNFVGEKPAPEQNAPVYDGDIIFTGADISIVAFGALEGDFNNNGIIDTLDVRSFKSAQSAYDPAADFNANGVVDTLDVRTFKGDM